jgi:hypothetical protein
MFLATIESILNASTIAAIRATASGSCEVLDPDDCSKVALAPARKLIPEQVSEVRDLLLDPGSWFFAKKRCMPRNTALFRLQNGSGEVRLSVGMSCLDWIVTSGSERRGGFFDPVQNRMRGLLKAIFPEFASPSARSMWKAGTIAQLRAAHLAVRDRGTSGAP